MNMLLHGIPDAELENGDTLMEPLHQEGGELMRFDRVITKPKKVALIACMRKLLTILNAMMRTNTTWQQVSQPETA